jgi:hypothetical protein
VILVTDGFCSSFFSSWTYSGKSDAYICQTSMKVRKISLFFVICSFVTEFRGTLVGNPCVGAKYSGDYFERTASGFQNALAC